MGRVSCVLWVVKEGLYLLSASHVCFGQKQTCAAQKVMSALPPIADIVSGTAQQKTPELSPEGFLATDKLIRRLASASYAIQSDPTRRDRWRAYRIRAISI